MIPTGVCSRVQTAFLAIWCLFGPAWALSAAPVEPNPPAAAPTGPGEKQPPAAAPALLGRQGLYIGLGFFAGTHRPEMEDRFSNDRFFAALLFNGFARNTAWENTSAAGLPWYASYHVARWQVGLEHSPVASSPNFNGVLSATIPSSPSNIGVASLDQTMFDSLARSNTTILGGYLLNPGSNVPVHLLFGLRSFSMNGDYQVLRLTRVTVGAASAEGLEATLKGRLKADASGPVLGVEMLLALADRWRFRARARLFGGAGAWRNTTLFGKSAPSAEYSDENGTYKVVATELELGVSFEVISNGSVFARFTTEKMRTTDSEVVLLKVSSVASENSNRATEFALTYPGSSQTDRLSGLVFGYEHRFGL